MKEIIAMIRPAQVYVTKQNLHKDGFSAYTSFRVLGRSRQRGLRYAKRSFFFWRNPKEIRGIEFVPKVYLSLIVADRDAALVVQCIIKSNQTGKIGDGKILVLPVDDALQIRNGLKGEICLQ